MSNISDEIIGQLPVHTAGNTSMVAVPLGVLEGVWAILKPYCNFQQSAPLPPVAQENQRRLLTLKEAADMLRVSKNTLNRYLNTGKVATVSELAQKVKQERAFLFRALSLVNLAPDIIEAILNGIRPSPLRRDKKNPQPCPFPSSAKASPKTGPSSGRCLECSKEKTGLHLLMSAGFHLFFSQILKIVFFSALSESFF
jgi:hypothetical protein